MASRLTFVKQTFEDESHPGELEEQNYGLRCRQGLERQVIKDSCKAAQRTCKQKL